MTGSLERDLRSLLNVEGDISIINYVLQLVEENSYLRGKVDAYENKVEGK